MITLYSTGCPKCGVLKKKLNAKNIRYELSDSVEELIGQGITEVPVLKVNDRYMRFAEACEWVNNYTEDTNGN